MPNIITMCPTNIFISKFKKNNNNNTTNRESKVDTSPQPRWTLKMIYFGKSDLYS